MLLLHVHPRVVPARTLGFTLTFGLGGMSLVLALFLVATGVLLLFPYEPSVDRAYDSVVALGADVPFGQFVRNTHRWGANLAVIVTFLHLLRVVFTGAFHGARRGNWIVGVLLLFLVLASNFTGYLLPWDQVAYWAVTISTSMLDYVPGIGPVLQQLLRGGADVGPRTLSTFYVLHIVFLPVGMVVLLSLHFWLVRKAGGVVLPRAPGEPPPPRDPLVPTSPHLTRREGATALVLLAALLAFSLIVNAPLEDRANPGLSPNPAKAPWYFMGAQELLVHFHPVFAVLVIPLLAAVFVLRLPFGADTAPTEGIWFLSLKGRRMAKTAAVVSLGITALAVLADEYLMDFPGWAPGIPPLITAGLLPFGMIAGLAVGLAVWF
jgi:quinol-cytochrome oxidoreductase complex cytochrome b subunit